MRLLTAIPVYNEERHLLSVLREVRKYSPHILVINDGSTDRTGELLAAEKDIHVVTHARNSGYGAALIGTKHYNARELCERCGNTVPHDRRN